MKQKQLLLSATTLFLMLQTAETATAETKPANTAIEWRAITNKGSTTKHYDTKNFAELLSTGLSDEKLKVSCAFKLEKRQAERDQIETVYIDCKAGDLNVSTSPVSCARGKAKPIPAATQSLFFDVHKLNFTVSCRTSA